MAAKKKETIRAFVALDLDTLSLRRVVRVAERLRMGSGAPSASWVPNVNLHVTLEFMGALPVDAVAPLGKAVGTLVESRPAPPPSPMKLAAFPDTKDARVIVVDLTDESGAIAALAAKVAKLALKYGVEKDDRPYRPHVTLARLKLGYDARRWLRGDLAEGAGLVRAGGVTLFKSESGGEHSKYTPLVRFRFAGD